MYLNEVNLTPEGKIAREGKQAEAIADHADTAAATAEDIAVKQNEILAALRHAGIIAS
ncbi:hypothetical protein SAMN05192534_12448 [Alteribacillus persepolensis]|uniref:Uncharacterized protein n=1 Tax=Alteribacillus persepolensis TaxID=568899 RepID=A0A1G8IKQ4_9BACI|nr:hypothetical protein [Alteribacillus persepolensis]SDI19090.1 hypothetical protein SAMN05192534_12448 [Alteribacillus persepolensis]